VCWFVLNLEGQVEDPSGVSFFCEGWEGREGSWKPVPRETGFPFAKGCSSWPEEQH